MSYDTVKYIEGIINYNRTNTIPIDKNRILTLSKFLELNNIFINKEIDPNHEIIEVLDEILAYLKKDEIYSTLVFDYKNLKRDLTLHFQNFLDRNYMDTTKEERLILKEISLKYPKYYNLAKKCSVFFNKHFSVQLSEQEISYITIYLFKNVLSDESKKRVVVVCATGRGLSTLLATKISHVFPSIEVVKTMSYYQLESLSLKKDIDFAISTIPIKNSVYPVVKISNIFSTKDINTIYDYLNNISSLSNLDLSNLENYPIDFNKSRDNNEKRLDIKSCSTKVSGIILSLIEFMNSISKDYPISEDTLLGLIIHLVMAIPRWLSPQEESESVEKKYYELEVNHPLLVNTMNIFFKNTEDTLYISISNYERYAFYQYILRSEKNE